MQIISLSNFHFQPVISENIYMELVELGLEYN